MNANYEKINPSPNGGIKFRTIILFLLIAFIGGTVAAGWAITKYDLFQTNSENEAIVVDRDAIANEQAASNEQAVASEAANSQSVVSRENIENQNDTINDQLINERVDSLDDRLSRINVQAQQASGNADRTESMLIAFSARRAIDSGSALGYVENELRLKFGNSNPDDVRAIIDASNNPVRLATLQNQLDIASEILLSPSSDASTWDIIQKEIGELFVIRKAGSQPPQPERRLARIKTALANRDVKTAILEMEQMPGAENARDWIALARRYIRVQQALDAVEKTAISIPSNALPIRPVAQQPETEQQTQQPIENAPRATGNVLN